MNAYTGKYERMCTYRECRRRQRIESNRHAVATCPRYAAARHAFHVTTGVRMCDDTYTDIMALDHRKLKVDGSVLATALCRLLATIAKAHAKTNHIASVAHSLERSQRRSIIQTGRSERRPDG